MAGLQSLKVPITNNEREILKWRNGLKQLIDQLGSVEFGSTYINGNIFTLDFDDTGGNVDVVFGKTVNKHLRHTGSQFQFDDDLLINADILIDVGSITSASAAISFGDENLSTTGTLASGVTTIDTTLVLASGSITDSGGAISFGNENLSTSGTLTLSALTQNSVLFAGAGGVVSEDTVNLVWDNGNLTLDVAKFEGLQIVTAKVNEGAGLTKGQAVYISGATGDKPQVSLADNTAHEKAHVLGIAAEAKADSQNIDIAIWGELVDVDTSGFDAAGDRMHLASGGAMQTAPLTSGAHVHMGFVTKKDAVNGIMFIAPETYSHDIRGTADTDVMLATGDDASTYKIIFDNYSGTELGSIQGDGLFTWNGQFHLSDNDILTFGNTPASPDARLYSDGTKLVLDLDTGNADFNVDTTGNANTLFIDESNGYIGIGTNAPAKTLDVAGDFKVTLNAENAIAVLDFAGSNILSFKTIAAVFEANNLLVSNTSADETAKKFAIEARHYDTDLDNLQMFRYAMNSADVANLDFGTALSTKNGFSNLRFWVSSDTEVLNTQVNMLDLSASDIIFNGTEIDVNFEVNASGVSNALYVLGSDGNVGIGTSTPTTKFSVAEKSGITPIGGLAIKLTNTTGAATVQGQTVKADPATNDAVILTAADDTECIGVFLESGIADDAEAWVVVAGIADVAMGDNEAATRGNWVETNSTEAGYADATAATPAAAPQHFNEIGHCIETVAAGGGGTHILARCVLHFN
jgi:hypothetical protein